ncbi:cytokinin dehydrogenase 3-like protein [Cinnamomum micranthum f. kanehirae]|uniref:cytokinin dehydrogenase n=1 Tax=Cinnamomum micranthum f. kanehirae TaxID=337451 RepID=A0A443NJ86_9MAGN|nr:cytokinin dehydrogenase 3-like protein [Cinnamomum micranthum f. kanehirae]
MEFVIFCTRFIVLVLLLTVSSPCKFIQSPMDFGPLKLLQSTTSASLDFGRIFFNSPSAVLRPQSPREISQLLNFLQTSSLSKVTVAARGAGHSIHGQAQALNGIVVEMDSLPTSIKIHKKGDGESGFSYADVSGGTLWVELLMESLKEGLSPRSWTDYLYLTIGGTLSNAGISGQTFKYGPQISNVLQLDVITGKGELVTCSPTRSSELFYAVLGGLGQFGIITSARILLQDAPQKVRWVRAFYDDFQKFIKDQELLISMADMVDYVEGFMVLNEQSLHSSSTAFPSQLGFIQQLQSGSSDVYYCIEFAVHYSSEKESNVDHVLEEISKKLNFMPNFIYSVQIPYLDFLNRVRAEEMSLRRRGLWDVSHPWLNMFVPRSGIIQFRDLLLETISPSTFEGPLLIYPILRDKWNSNTSAVLPESSPAGENILYIVGMLQSANPNTCSSKCLQGLLQKNRRLVEGATHPQIGAKQYLPHYTQEAQWRDHFGSSWDRFLVRKSEFDPLSILAPGQAIFNRKYQDSVNNYVI